MNIQDMNQASTQEGMSHGVVLWKFPRGKYSMNRGENIKDNSGRRQRTKKYGIVLRVPGTREKPKAKPTFSRFG